MTLKTSGSLSFSEVNTECGRSASAAISMSWIRDNSYYGITKLNSLYGKAYFQAKSSQNNITRTTASVSTNCPYACSAQYPALRNCDCGDNNCSPVECNYGYGSNCEAIANVNCNECAYTHGGVLLQPNCNCNCQCWNCNCRYNNCDCNTTCDCGFQC